MKRPLHIGTEPDAGRFTIDADRLRTHGVVVGMTGSGKTGLCLVLLEELVRAGVPIIAIDPKGDLANLGLVFPDLAPSDFAAWTHDEPAEVASRWAKGIERAGLEPEAMAELRHRMELSVYTPGSEAGIPVNLLASFSRPSEALLRDEEARRELVVDTVSGLLGLVGVDADPVKDPAHITLSYIIERAWSAGEDPDLETLILRLVDPPFEKVGVFSVDRFFAPDDRMKLAMSFNGVVASPAFSAWGRGASLDIDRMLQAGPKTGVHVFSIAHLDEAERQFFVSILLGRLQAWSRSQPGTEDLRALLFFDEVAGHLPPHPKNPPTKRPLLTMMKQARAVGLGVVLATQNPVDVDYKALSNAGLWCIGRLTTSQDRERLLKGIEGQALDATVAKLEKRQFLIHQVGRGEPVVIESRHAMCFLRGPLTRVEVGAINALFNRAQIETAPPPPSKQPAPRGDDLLRVPPAVDRASAWFLDQRVVFSARMEDAFTPSAEPTREDQRVVHRPALYADIIVRFDEDRAGFLLDHRERRVWFPLEDALPEAASAVRINDSDLLNEPPKDALFAPLPTWLDDPKELTDVKKRVVDDVYRSETRGMYRNRPLEMYGKAKESADAFEARCRRAVEDHIDKRVAKLKAKFEAKADRLEERIRKKEQKLVELEGVAKARKLDEAVNIGETILSFFGGRKKSFGSAVRKRGQSARAARKVTQLREDMVTLAADVEELHEEMEDAIREIREDEERALEETEEAEVRLEKNDIRVHAFGILWIPCSRRL